MTVHRHRYVELRTPKIVRCSLLAASAFLFATAGDASAQQAPAAPVIPFNSNFWSYWTHYWATWLPDHPVYEMIELTAYENPRDRSDLLVRVFLTERAGRKRQYFYLNSEAEVRRSRANAFFRPIDYRRTGPEGGPQNLSVSFADKDGVPIRWNIRFDPSAKLRKHDAGLTPSIHSVGSVLLFALRTSTVDTVDDEVKFGSVDYAAQGNGTQPGTRSWFNPDYYSAVLIFGTTTFAFKNGTLSNNWGRSFQKVSGRDRTYRSNSLGPENFIEIETDHEDGIRRYAHFSRGHSLGFRFDPPIPSTGRARDRQTHHFEARFDDRRMLMRGFVRIVRSAPDKVKLEWVPTSPSWAVGRGFQSVLRSTSDGYELTSADSHSDLSGK